MNEPVELDQSARDLIAAGRDGIAPSDATVERLRRSVDRTLRGPRPPARSSVRTVPILAALGAAALGGVLYASQLALPKGERATPPPAPSSRAVPSSPAAVPPAVSVAKPDSSAPASASPIPATAAVPSDGTSRVTTGRTEPARPPRSQQLGAEIELLSRVNAAVNAGEGARALALLAEYDRTFRPSILAEERAAASVLALCAAGRTAEARTAAGRFARSWQRSPLLGRIAASCAGAR